MPLPSPPNLLSAIISAREAEKGYIPPYACLWLRRFSVELSSTVAFILFPELLVGLFLRIDNTAARIAIEGFPYYGVGSIFFILDLSVIGYYQSIERIKPAITFAVLRGFIFLLPCFMVLPEIMGVKGIWLALPLSEILTSSLIVTAFRMHFPKHYKEPIFK